MNKKIIWLIAIAIAISALVFFFKFNKIYTSGENGKELTVYSYHYGYQLWKDIKKYPISLSLNEVIEGMKACHEGKPLPEDDETVSEFIQKMALAQKQSFQEQARNNLMHAEEFLAKIAQQPNVQVIEEKKLYYEIKKAPDSTIHVEPGSSVFFHYTITTLDNEEIVDTRKDNSPKKINLATALPGFSKGVIGMSRGERRILYVHPDLAYGRFRHGIAPQILIIIDVQFL